MFEKLKEKRELKKQQKAAAARAVAQQFFNDVRNPDRYKYNRIKGPLYKVRWVGVGDVTNRTLFTCQKNGDYVSIHSNCYMCEFQNSYHLGSCDLKSFFSEACRLFEEYGWDSSICYCSGSEGSIYLHLVLHFRD